MLTIGTYVIHEKYGICLVMEIQKNMKVGTKRSDYFVLKPVYNPSSSVYIPLTNKTAEEKLKALPTAEEILKLLESGNKLEWLEDGKTRSDLFEKILSDGDRKKILEMIKCIEEKKKELAEQAKKLRIADETALKTAEKIIYEEFSFILGIPKENVGEYIRRIYYKNT